MITWQLADLFWILALALFSIVGYLWFVQLKTLYYRLLIRLGKVELRPLGPINVGEEKLVINRKAICVRGVDTGIVMYLTGDAPLLLRLPGFGLNPALTKGDLLFRSRVGGAPAVGVTKVVASVLAEDRWVALPEVRRFLGGGYAS